MRRMRVLGLCLLCAVALLTPAAVYADGPPANDNLAGASTIDAAIFTGSTARVLADGAAATTEPDEPMCGYYAATVWYTFTAPTAGSVKVVPVSGGSSPYLNAYIASGSDFGSLTRLNECSWNWMATLTFAVDAGSTYYVQVAGTLPLDFSFAPPIPNDNLAGASLVTTFPSASSVDLSFATRESGEPDPCSYGAATRSVWYAFSVAEKGVISVDARQSDFTFSLAVYQAAGSASQFSDLTFVSCPYSGWSASIDADPGITYYVQASDSYSTPGTLNLSSDFSTPPANDALAAATPVEAFPFSDVADLRAATMEPGETGGCCASAWYRITPPGDGTLTVDPSGSTFANIEWVYTGASSATDVGQLTFTGYQTWNTPFTFPVTAGTTYYVQARDYGYRYTGFLHLAVTADLKIPPVLALPGDVTAEASGPDGAVVTYAASATDQSGGSVPIACDPVSGSVFPLGTTRVVCSATDANGTSTGSFAVTVQVTYPAMANLTNAWVGKTGVAAQLTAYLGAAARAEARGNLKAEAGNLESYRALIRAQAGKAISQDDAATLITFSYLL